MRKAMAILYTRPVRVSRVAGLLSALAFVGLGALAINGRLIGVFNDDAIYLSSGLSLIQDGAYRIGFLPGSPLAGKYPPLFPLLLGLFGWVSPASAGLFGFKALSLALAAPGFVALAGLLARPSLGLSRAQQLSVLALSGLSASFIATAIEVMSEGLFFSLSMAALWVATPDDGPDTSAPMLTRAPRRLGMAFGLALLACYARGVGVALCAALAIGMLVTPPLRRKAPWFVLGVGVGLVPLSYWSRVYVPAHEPMTELLPYLLSYDYHSAGLSAYLSSPEGDALSYGLAALRTTVKGLSAALLPCPTDPAAADPWAPIPPQALGLTALVLLGAVAELRRARLCAVYALLYAGLVCLWPWFNKARFFVVIVPLLWLLCLRGVETLCGRFARLRRGLLVTGALLAGLSQLTHYGGQVFLGGNLADAIAQEGDPTVDDALERSLRWVTEHTSPDSVLVINMSGPLYAFRTGRQVLPYRMALVSAAEHLAANLAGRTPDPPPAALSTWLARARPWLGRRPLVHVRLCPGPCPVAAHAGPPLASFQDLPGGPEIRIDGLSAPMR